MLNSAIYQIFLLTAVWSSKISTDFLITQYENPGSVSLTYSVLPMQIFHTVVNSYSIHAIPAAISHSVPCLTNTTSPTRARDFIDPRDPQRRVFLHWAQRLCNYWRLVLDQPYYASCLYWQHSIQWQGINTTPPFFLFYLSWFLSLPRSSGS